MNDRIVIDPKICHGKPVIRGTRLPVAILMGSLAGGMTFDELQREYGITSDDIRAALNSPVTWSSRKSIIHCRPDAACVSW